MTLSFTRVGAVASSVFALSLVVSLVGAQDRDRNHSHNDRQRGDNQHRQSPERNATWAFGDPIPNLDATSLEAFRIGAEEFVSVEDIEGGLGPIFNDSSCVACHSNGATGGASDEKVTQFGRLVNGEFDGLEALGGSLLQAKSIDPAVAEIVPPEATIVAQRVATPVFGAGLIEAIDDETIKTNALRRQPEGISGRVAIIIDQVSGDERVGRFGWKAQEATLLSFAGLAYRNEMGVTNRFFPEENAPNGNVELLRQYDLVPELEDELDPETGLGDVDHLANFMRFLAPPPPLKKTASALAGGKLFRQAECDSCHTPMMMTGQSDVAALAGQQVRLYSDLLLHDMGELADGIAQGGATMTEMKTAPLWGIRARTSFLHDGRASTIGEAINEHAGEAKRARDLFVALSEDEKVQVLDYLMSN